ncbi:hypothetical protein ABTE52_22025, partial [Acinetobacter baumannii]
MNLSGVVNTGALQQVWGDDIEKAAWLKFVHNMNNNNNNNNKNNNSSSTSFEVTKHCTLPDYWVQIWFRMDEETMAL